MNPAVSLVEAYLRLNGYLTATEYAIQRPSSDPDAPYETATDIDVLAVRLPRAVQAVLRHPYREGEPYCEVLLEEDPLLDLPSHRMDVLLAEVKEGEAQLNRALRSRTVLHAALHRLGCCPPENLDGAVEALQSASEALLTAQPGIPYRVRLLSFAGRPPEREDFPVPYIPLTHVVRFVTGYFQRYREILQSAPFSDPSLGLFKLLDKLGVPPEGGGHD